MKKLEKEEPETLADKLFKNCRVITYPVRMKTEYITYFPATTMDIPAEPPQGNAINIKDLLLWLMAEKNKYDDNWSEARKAIQHIINKLSLIEDTTQGVSKLE
jgi:hypothetical protein